MQLTAYKNSEKMHEECSDRLCYLGGVAIGVILRCECSSIEGLRIVISGIRQGPEDGAEHNRQSYLDLVGGQIGLVAREDRRAAVTETRVQSLDGGVDEIEWIFRLSR